MTQTFTLPQVVSGNHLNEDNIDHFIPPTDLPESAIVEFDLKGIEFATPYAIILLVMLIKSCQKRKISVKVLLPVSKDVLNYLERMSFFESIDTCAVTYDEDPAWLRTNQKNVSSTAIEITRIRKEADVTKVVNDLAEKLITAHGCNPKAINKFSEIMIETLQNTTQHSDPTSGIADGLAAVQIYKKEFHFVIGDCGIGIRESLKLNQRYSAMNLSDSDAIAGVLKHAYTRIDVPGRGGGLERVQEIAKKMSGVILIRSNEGLVKMGPDLNLTKSAVNLVGGTQICIKCPTSLFREQA